MPWCSKCEVEYLPGITECGDCGEVLVDVLPEKEQGFYGPPAFVRAVTTTMEADHMEALLITEKIPVIKRSRGAGAYLKAYLGASTFGVDLYVPEEFKDQAKELLASIWPEEEPVFQEEDGEEEKAAKRYDKRRRIGLWVMIFLVSGLVWIIFLLIRLFGGQ